MFDDTQSDLDMGDEGEEDMDLDEALEEEDSEPDEETDEEDMM